MSDALKKAIESLEEISDDFVLVPVEVMSEIESALCDITDRVSKGHGGVFLHGVPSLLVKLYILLKRQRGIKCLKYPLNMRTYIRA